MIKYRGSVSVVLKYCMMSAIFYSEYNVHIFTVGLLFSSFVQDADGSNEACVISGY